MNNQTTTESFLEVMSEFLWPMSAEISYRLYHKEDGTPECYSMDNLPGKYVEVDAETFASRPWNVRVVDGKLQFIQPRATVQKLWPNTAVGTACHTQDVCIIVSEQQPHTTWNKIINEIN
jgi:hypothetical protein